MSDDSLIQRLPLGAGAGAGVGAYLFGYLLTYLTNSSSMEERLAGFNFVADLFGGESINAWQGVGWLFYNAHFVRTRVTGGLGGPRSQNFIAGSDGGAVVLLYLVPVLFLLAAGLLVGRFAGASGASDAAAAGATVTLGYLPLALLGHFLFAYDGSIAPDLVTALLLSGLAYPLVFGALGGVAWSALREDDAFAN